MFVIVCFYAPFNRQSELVYFRTLEFYGSTVGSFHIFKPPFFALIWVDQMASSNGLRKRNVASESTNFVVTDEGKASDQRLDTHET